MDDKFYFLSEQLKTIAKSAMAYANRAHNIIFSDNSNDIAIIGYLNYASSLVGTAKSIYISNYDILEHNDIDDFFNQFNVFIAEVLNNIETNHSHQWSDIEFRALQEKFDYCVLSQ